MSRRPALLTSGRLEIAIAVTVLLGSRVLILLLLTSGSGGLAGRLLLLGGIVAATWLGLLAWEWLVPRPRCPACQRRLPRLVAARYNGGHPGCHVAAPVDPDTVAEPENTEEKDRAAVLAAEQRLRQWIATTGPRGQQFLADTVQPLLDRSARGDRAAREQLLRMATTLPGGAPREPAGAAGPQAGLDRAG